MAQVKIFSNANQPKYIYYVPYGSKLNLYIMTLCKGLFHQLEKNCLILQLQKVLINLVEEVLEVLFKAPILPMLVTLWGELFAIPILMVTQPAPRFIGLTIFLERPFLSKTAENILYTTWQIHTKILIIDIVDNDFNAIEVRYQHAEQKTHDLKIK